MPGVQGPASFKDGGSPGQEVQSRLLNSMALISFCQVNLTDTTPAAGACAYISMSNLTA